MSLSESQRKRVCTVYIVLLGVFLGLVGRLAWIQLYDHPWFQEQAELRQVGKSEMLARRGTIFDRCKRVLAESVWVESATADPTIVRNKDVVARVLAQALKLDFRQTLAKLQRQTRFVWIKRFLSRREAWIVRQANLTGVFMVREAKRVYPLGRVACHLVGFCTIDGDGLEGAEAACDAVLSGVDGHREVWRDGARRFLILPGMKVTRPKHGLSVVLTIDSVIQAIVHRELADAFAALGAEAAIGMVLDCNTGQVLAMVSLPDYCPDRWASGPSIEPKRFTKAYAHLRRNRAITDLFEPGSIFKPFVVSSAFELGIVKPEEVFYCHHGSYSIGRRVLHDAHGYGHLTAREAVIKSSNIGLAQIAQKTGKEHVYRYLRRFGFGQTTGFDLPGEPCGTLRRPRYWRPRYSLPSIAMGQEVSATPLRLATSFCALGNGGVVPRPFVIMAHEDARTGETLWRAQPGRGAKRAVEPQTSRGILAPILADVVKVGTGRRAAQEGYTLGGKTGTAQLRAANGRGYASKAFFSSFIAMAPMEAPKICVAVMMVRPRVDARKTYYGGTASAPVVGRVAKQTLHYMGVRPYRSYAGDAHVENTRGQLSDPIVAQSRLRGSTSTRPPQELPRLRSDPHDQGEQI